MEKNTWENLLEVGPKLFQSSYNQLGSNYNFF